MTNGVSTGAYGTINRVKLPFIGTNGRSACPKISPLQTRQAVGAGNQCALNQGQAYTYSNTFPILAIYPSVSVLAKLKQTNKQTNKQTFSLTWCGDFAATAKRGGDVGADRQGHQQEDRLLDHADQDPLRGDTLGVSEPFFYNPLSRSAAKAFTSFYLELPTGRPVLVLLQAVLPTYKP